MFILRLRTLLLVVSCSFEKYESVYRFLSNPPNPQLNAFGFSKMSRSFDFLRRKINGSDQSEMDIKVIIPAPTQ